MKTLNPHYRYSTCASFVALAVAAPVSAQSAAEVEIRTGAIAATDPFAEGAGDSEAVAISLEVLPELRWEDQTSVVRLAGAMRFEEWLSQGYGSDLSGDVSLYAEEQTSETLRLYGSLGYQTRERAIPDLLVSSLSTDDLDTSEDFDVPTDPTFGRNLQRRQNASANFGLEKRVSETGQLRFSTTSEGNWFEGDGQDYRTTNLETSFVEQLSPRTSMVIGLSGALSDYTEQSIGDGVFGNATLGFGLKLSETGTLQTSAGAGVARVETGLNGKESKTFLVANVNFCEQANRSRMCLSGSRQSRPSRLGGVSRVTSARLGWNLQLGEAEYLDISASYTETKATLAEFDVIEALGTKYAAASMRYSLPIAENLGFYISPSATKIFDDPFGRDDNYQLSIGLSYRFGRN